MVAQTQLEMRTTKPETAPVARTPLRCDDDAPTFVRIVENCFLEIRGRGVHWSPLDSARATGWHALGLPAAATVRVLQARVLAWRFRHGATARLPHHLAWYEPAVLEHCRHLARLGDGSADALHADELAPEVLTVATPTVTALVAELTALLSRPQSAAVAHVYGKTFDWLDRALQGADPDAAPDAAMAPTAAPELAVLVETCRRRMNKLLAAALPPAEALQLTAHLREQAIATGTLSAKARKMREERLTERWLAGHFGHHVPTLAGWQDPRAL